MIFTVFIAANSAEEQWPAEVLEYAWQRCAQTGELVRLVPGRPGSALPAHLLAQVEPTQCWAQHPYLDDHYPGYNLPAAVLEWLLREQVDGTVVLMEAGSILRQAFDREVAPGKAVAHHWENVPEGDGPFGLDSPYASLRAYCVNRDLALPRIQLPLLIHSSDLAKICARWLELMGILRSSPDADGSPPPHAVKVSLAIAAAEYALDVEAKDLGGHIIEAEDGGREFLDYSDRFTAARAGGEQLRSLRPSRRPGVRQACVLDQWYLELGARSSLISLNVSAGAIWKLCDGQRTLLEIVQQLQAQYPVPLETMVADVIEATKILRAQGAIKLENLS